jgi:polysaccharide pyruvyl transferase WcaK-like protein
MINLDTVTGIAVLGVTRLAGRIRYRKWKPGERLRMLLVGYNGKRNTGADVRVSAMVEQFYRIFGRDAIELGILTLDVKNLQVYFDGSTRLIPFSSIFFKDLLRACSEYHVAILCEGSCLKSKFANALTLFFCEAAGVMKRQGKPCLAYGSEAGYMDPALVRIVRATCRDTYFIARTEPSLDIIRRLGLKGHIGTDTAWTFPSAGVEWATHELVSAAGWDGKKPLVGAAVINPFCWPVRPSLTRWVRAAVTGNREDNYEKWYFFSSSAERKRMFEGYARSIAGALDYFSQKYNAQVLLIGMEALDAEPCRIVRKLMNTPCAVFSSLDYDGYRMNSILRSLSLLVTSRYHARVLSTPAGIPSIALSMDERLYNLLKESGHLDDFYLRCDEERLEEKLPPMMDQLWRERARVSVELLGMVPHYLKVMGEMGMFFRDWIALKFPQLPIPSRSDSWQDYLPPLYPELEKLL